MTIIFQKVYKREDARRNPDVLYVFGDNVHRRGLGGQAGEMRGEGNAVGVATKYSPYENYGEEPAQVIAQKRIIDDDMKPLFECLKNGGVVIWPTDGIGTGLAALPTYAPSTFDYIREKLAALIQVGKLFDKGLKDSAYVVAQPHIDLEAVRTVEAIQAAERKSTSRLPPSDEELALRAKLMGDRLVRPRVTPARELDRLLANARPATEEEIIEQRKSWARQDKD